MADYETEEQQVEALKAWWAENGRSVIAGVVIGLGIIFGWRGWQSHELDYARESSSVYFDFKKAVEADDAEARSELFSSLKEDYSDTPYAVMAALQMAKSEVEAERWDEAIAQLSWAKEQAQDEDVQAIIGLRLARLQLQQGALDEALEALPEGEQAGQFLAMSSEIKGDIYLAKGEAGKARDAYQEARDQRSPVPDRQLLDMKYYDLIERVEDGA